MFDAANVHESLADSQPSAFAFSAFAGLSPNEIHAASAAGPLCRWLLAWHRRRSDRDLAAYWEAAENDGCALLLP